jgi:thiol:disulfide interchange protein DsbC
MRHWIVVAGLWIGVAAAGYAETPPAKAPEAPPTAAAEAKPAGDAAATAAQADAAAAKGNIQNALKAMVGSTDKLQINPSPIPGLYEVVLDTYVFYVTADGRYILRDADILDLKEDGKNLTELRRNKIRLAELNQLKKESMIVFAPKETKHVLTVFTDVDCFYCAKLHQEVSKLNELGIEVRYLAFPRSGVNSPTYKKMVSVWCAKDPRQALTDAKSGKEVPEAKCDNPVQADYEFGKRLGISGTPALILPNGELLPGYAPAAKLAQYLDNMKAE